MKAFGEYSNSKYFNKITLLQNKQTVDVQPWFVTSDDLLKDAHTRPSLSFPVLWVRVQSLQNVKGFSSIVELTHLWKNIYDYVLYNVPQEEAKSCTGSNAGNRFVQVSFCCANF